jgi:hypothetical protein
MSAGQDITGSGFTMLAIAVEKLLLESGSGAEPAIVAVLLSRVPPAAEQLMAPTSVMVRSVELAGGNVTV